MATEYARKMDAAVRKVGPLLHERGFKKQRHVFNAEPEAGLTQVLTFQMGAHQPPGTTEVPGLRETLYGRFTINLGLHLAEVAELPKRSPALEFALKHGLPAPPPRPPPKFLNDGHCQLTWRLGELIDGRDTWWSLDAPEAELQRHVPRLVEKVALPFFDRFNSRDGIIDAWQSDDPALQYAPAFTIAVIRACRGETAEAEELVAAELRDTDHPGARQEILDAAAHLGLEVSD
jgi:Domain of unknown function (DUF4304)